MSNARSLILFSRSPELGKVKTRLASQLGDARVYDLYQRMVQRQVRLVNAMPGINRQCWVEGNDNHPVLQPFEGSRYRQQGADIGERMGHALAQALTSSDCAVLIGCDSPGIDASTLESAFKVLESGHDAVLGPASDGGYVLIGLRQPQASLFQGMDWGTSRVLEQTRSALVQAGLTWSELPAMPDIDEPRDLVTHAELVSREYGLDDWV